MRTIVLAAAVAALAATAPAVAAGPDRFGLDTTLTRGETATLTLGPFPQGEFRFRLRASSDGVKRVRLTQRRAGGRPFLVVDTATPGPPCEGASGSVYCTGLSTPVTPGGRRWVLTLRSTGGRPTHVSLLVVFRRVTSAG